MSYKMFVTFTLCASLLVSTGFVRAQTTTPSSTDETLPPSVNTPTKRPFTPEPTLQKIAQTRLLNLAANMSNRMDKAVARLQNVTDRLTSRLNKMTEEGKDVSGARAELAIAQTKLDEAKRTLSTIDTEVNGFIGSATPRENWENLKATYLGTSATIIAAHRSILAAIEQARAVTAPALMTGTSTASTTNN